MQKTCFAGRRDNGWPQSLGRAWCFGWSWVLLGAVGLVCWFGGPKLKADGQMPSSERVTGATRQIEDLPSPLRRKTEVGRSAAPVEVSPSPHRWKQSIRKFEQMDRQNPPKRGGILFVGSSSIVRWDLKKYFPDLPVLNRGFGGSEVADVLYFADRIVLPYRPKVIVLYAGDNDLARGKSPEQVVADYEALVAKVLAALPKTRIVYIAIKPSIARWALIDRIRQTNRLIQTRAAKDNRLVVVDVEPPMLGPDGQPRAELFQKDGLHLSEAGYQLWSELVRPHLKLDP